MKRWIKRVSVALASTAMAAADTAVSTDGTGAGRHRGAPSPDDQPQSGGVGRHRGAPSADERPQHGAAWTTTRPRSRFSSKASVPSQYAVSGR
jgi:hypothetical protein